MSEDTKLKELIINTLSPEQMPAELSETEIYLVEDDAEYATVEELANKQDVINDLQQIRDNASTGAGLAPQVAVNTQRIEDLTTAKFPNVVIIGTPHIEGGQVSNYSNTSYLQFPFVDISRGQPFDIYFSFTTSNDVTTQQNILDSYFGIALAIQNGKGIMALSSNGTNWDIGTATGTNTLLPNTTYYVKYSWTGTAYSAALSTNDETYVPDMNLTSSLSPHKTTIFIGGSPNLFGPSTAHPFKGTINFNKSKVVVNGITVWEGMADVGLASRANVSLNNLDDVGEARFNAKQDVITDLATIRDGASKGATALQNITSSDVTTALGFIPYNSTNPNGYTSNKGTVTKVNNTSPDANGNVTISIPSEVTESTVSGWGFTKNAGTITGIKMNGASKGTSGEVDLGTVITSHQSLDSCVKTSGNQTVAGVKTFTGNPVFQSSTFGTQITVKRTTANYSVIDYQNSNGHLGYLGYSESKIPISTPDNTSFSMVVRTPQKSGTSHIGTESTGSATQPVYINANGIATACNVAFNTPYSLLDCKWSDHEISNLSWLRSNGQWNNGNVYKSVYDLLADIQAGRKTIAGVSVKLSTATYTDYDFVINTSNKTFRLAIKTKIASGKVVVGNGNVLGLTNGSGFNGTIGVKADGQATSYYAGYPSNLALPTFGTSMTGLIGGQAIGITTDPKKSGIETDTTGLYLYYYVGETVQNANIINVADIASQLTRTHIIKTFVDGTSGYNIWSNGYCNQWGSIAGINGSYRTVTLIKSFKDINYNITTSYESSLSSMPNTVSIGYYNKTINSFKLGSRYIQANETPTYISWSACGYLKEGEY